MKEKIIRALVHIIQINKGFHYIICAFGESTLVWKLQKSTLDMLNNLKSKLLPYLESFKTSGK